MLSMTRPASAMTMTPVLHEKIDPRGSNAGWLAQPMFFIRIGTL